MCFFFCSTVLSVLGRLFCGAAVNGKTSIDNLLPVIYRRYIFVKIHFVFTLEANTVILDMRPGTPKINANHDRVIFVIDP